MASIQLLNLFKFAIFYANDSNNNVQSNFDVSLVIYFSSLVYLFSSLSIFFKLYFYFWYLAYFFFIQRLDNLYNIINTEWDILKDLFYLRLIVNSNVGKKNFIFEE